MLSSAPSRRICVSPLASSAPTPLRPRRRAKVNINTTAPADVASLLPRSPIDAITDQIPDPILRVAVKEPVAFWGGLFAGVFRLSLDQDPLRTWVERTASQARAATGQSQQP